MIKKILTDELDLSVLKIVDKLLNLKKNNIVFEIHYHEFGNLTLECNLSFSGSEKEEMPND